MFANYRYSAILRRVTPSTQANPKNDPILIGELQGVSGLKTEEVTKGYFGESSTLRFLQKTSESSRYTAKKLQFVGDNWNGFGELLPTDIVKSYSINGNGTYSEPSLIEGIRESFYVITNSDDEERTSLIKVYDIHIENITNRLPVNSVISIDGTQLGTYVGFEGGAQGLPSLSDPQYINRIGVIDPKTNIRLQILGSSTYETAHTGLGVVNDSDVYMSIYKPGNGGDKLADNGANNSLSDYSTMPYKLLMKKGEETAPGSELPGEDFRSPKYRVRTNANSTHIVTDVYGMPVTNDINSVRKISTTNPNGQFDFIEFRISSYVFGESVSFTAFLTSFNDNISPAWEDVKYVGRQDTLKHFVGSTRTAGVGFKVAAFNRNDIDRIYGKLNTLVKYAGVAGVDSSTVLTGPAVKLTLGNWFYNTPCVVTSIKYDVQLADYSWDIGKELPHLVDVSLDFFILGDKQGNALNSSTNRYI